MTTDPFNPFKAAGIRDPLSKMARFIDENPDCFRNVRLSALEMIGLVERLQVGDLTFDDVISRLREADKMERRDAADKLEALRVLRSVSRQLGALAKPVAVEGHSDDN